MLRIYKNICLAASLLSMFAIAPQAVSQPANFLERQFTIVVPYGPGGLTDARGRAFQAHMSDIVGVPVIVQNVSGGGALVGTNFVYSRPSDGQHVLIASGSDGPHAHSVLSSTKLQWDWENWKPIGQFARSVLGFVVPKKSNYKSMQEMIEQVQKKPGSVTLASLGPGRADDLYMLEFMKETDTLGKWNWVFYGSSANAQADLLTGDLDVAYIGVSRKDMINHPNFNVLAQGITEDEKPSDWPFTWPTVEGVVGKKLGLIGASYATVFVKADTPPDRVAFLELAFEKTANDPGFIATREKFGEPALWRNAAQAQDQLNQFNELLKQYLPLKSQMPANKKK